jgi:tetratricopeptide (TPR) repeat protein
MPDLSHQPGYDELAPFRTLSNIPYFPQFEDQCGPASLATVLVANGVDVKPEQLRDKLYIPGKEGVVTTEMVARVRRYGLLAYVLRPELVDVLAEINAGTPVLVMQNLGFAWLPRWHFSVAIAYNLDAQSITLRSGDKRQHEISISLFLKTWRRANSWAMVVVPAGALPATANPKRLIKAATDLEQVGEQVAALKVYQSLLQRWPNTVLADFGAGNSAYALGRYEDAHDYFSSYLQVRPDAAEGWNNLAYNLVALGCGSQALQAIRCGLKLTPDNPMLVDSFHELNDDITAAAASADACPNIQCPVK